MNEWLMTPQQKIKLAFGLCTGSVPGIGCIKYFLITHEHKILFSEAINSLIFLILFQAFWKLFEICHKLLVILKNDLS